MAKSIKRYKNWALITLLLIILMGSYFAFNPSYEKSIEAKFHFSIGNYEKAYTLSAEAYKIEPYNRMAHSVMVHSKYALRYVHYNTQAQEYLKAISSYANQDKISLSEQMRIKMMCEIMIDKHEKMQPTILIDKDLVEESREYYEKFIELHANLTKVL